jgi:DNA sulfur modification protein DndD
MLLERLTVCDFGLFRGQHVLELAPRKKYGSARPVILFGGLNGAGKTTILTAVRTALYGRQSMGFGASQKAYEEFLGNLIHKNKNAVIPTNAASVSLEFTYSQLGRQSHYRVNRSWVKNGKRLDETLGIYRDGTLLESLSHEQAQAFLNQLIPIGVSELFFFDGEKIARLASDAGEVALSSSIRRLLGLDVLDKLKADLSIYSRQKRGKTLTDAQGLEVSSLQQQLDTLKQETDVTLRLLREEVVPTIDRVCRSWIISRPSSR